MKFISRNAPSLAPLLDEVKARYGDAPGTPLSTILQFLLKCAAKHLRNHLATKHNVALSHGQALDAISASLGFADWNTANAATRHAGEDALDTPAAAQPVAAAVTLAGRALSSSIEFATSSLVVGPAGCGKSVGLLFAVQRSAALYRDRPVVIVRGPESPRHQPNWGHALASFGNVEKAGEIDPTRAVSGQDKLEIEALDGVWSMAEDVRDNYYKHLVTELLEWLDRRAHLKPLVLVEEAYSALGSEADRLLRDAPAVVTFVWTAQCLQDFKDEALLTSRFKALHLMRGSDRSLPATLGQLIQDDPRQAVDAVKKLGVGEAVQLFFRAPGPVR